MRNEHLTGNGSSPEVGAQPSPRRASVFQKALSVLLAALLVVTMNPLANDASALAQAADGAREALGAPASDGTAQDPSDAAPSESSPGGGCLQLM